MSSVSGGKGTWNFLSSGFSLDKGLDDFIDFTFFETDADFLTSFVVGDTDCRHDVCVGPEIGFDKINAFFFEVLVLVAGLFPFCVPAVGGFMKDFDGCFIVFVYNVNQNRRNGYCSFELTFDFFQVSSCSVLERAESGGYLVEFFSHEHVLLGDEAVYFDAVGFVLLFQL